MANETSDQDPARGVARDRWTIVLATVIVIIQLVALPVVVRLTGDHEPEAAESAEPEEPELDEHEFSGDEPGRTDLFPLEGGLTVFEIAHDGGGNFIAVLEDEEFERVAGLVNAIGDFDGSTATYVDPGQYRVAVQGRHWSVTARQPRYAEADPPPVSFAGDGPGATAPFDIRAGGGADGDGDHGGNGNGGNGNGNGGNGNGDGEQDAGEEDAGENGNGGEDAEEDAEEDARDDEPEPRTVRFAITHEGEGNIRVTLLDRDGRRAAGILNDRDAVDTTEQIDLAPGIYLLDVRAEGPWTIEVE